MQNPIAAAAEWFDRQSQEIKNDFGFLVGYVVIPDKFSDKPAEKFREWLTPTGNAQADVSKALLLRSAVELVLASRFTEEGWQCSAKFSLHVREKLISEGKDTGFVDRPLREFPERAAEWIRLGEEWRQLVSERLSDEVLNAMLFKM